MARLQRSGRRSGRLPLAGLILVMIASTVAALPACAQQSLETFEREELTIATASGEDHRFSVEMALTRRQKSQGLMFRKELPADAGMLFVYRPSSTVGMWMRNTVLPLDMLFIAEDGEIVKIVERTVPFSLATISSERPVRAVLEINGGMSARLGLRPGDRVIHPAFETNP